MIEALTEMRNAIDTNASFTQDKKAALNQEVANESIYGIDAGRDPALSKIARINMYLHGDGGSRIYMTDSLRSSPDASDADSPEVHTEVAELRKKLDEGAQFDVVLTNPPFSMGYSSDSPEDEMILNQYELSTWEGKKRSSLKSSIMFLERYWNLLRPEGRILTVIDDSVLSGKGLRSHETGL